MLQFFKQLVTFWHWGIKQSAEKPQLQTRNLFFMRKVVENQQWVQWSFWRTTTAYCPDLAYTNAASVEYLTFQHLCSVQIVGAYLNFFYIHIERIHWGNNYHGGQYNLYFPVMRFLVVKRPIWLTRIAIFEYDFEE